MVLGERLLNRMQRPAIREPLDRRHLDALEPHRKQRATLERATADQNGTRAALARIATDLRPRQPQIVAENMNEQRPRLHVEPRLLAVHTQPNPDQPDAVDHPTHLPPSATVYVGAGIRPPARGST
jgi:hypothetical protein